MDVVVEVLDGDTLVIPGKQRVRLKRVEAPGLENCGGETAKKRLEELVLGKEITLKGIVVDKYRRLVAFVYLDGVLINEILLREGMVMFLGANAEMSAIMHAAADSARKEKIGIYSPECLPEEPPSPECLIKGNVSQDKPGNKIYHFPGCSAYEQIKVERSWGDDWFCSESEAEKAGFRKSENCYGKKFESGNRD